VLTGLDKGEEGKRVKGEEGKSGKGKAGNGKGKKPV
jgi:hypothetical protein